MEIERVVNLEWAGRADKDLLELRERVQGVRLTCGTRWRLIILLADEWAKEKRHG